MAKVVKKSATTKVATKKVVTKKPTTKKTTVKKPVCKCGPKCACKTQKVSIKSVKQTPVKKSFWTKVAEFFGF